jgi:hypothetical protein
MITHVSFYESKLAPPAKIMLQRANLFDFAKLRHALQHLSEELAPCYNCCAYRILATRFKSIADIEDFRQLMLAR